MTNTALTRRSAIAALGASAFALASAAAARPARAVEAAQADAATAAPLESANAITAPEVLGSLPLFCEGVSEVDLGETLVLATPYYSVALPKELLGDGFSWTWDDSEVVTPGTQDLDGDGTADDDVTTSAFLTVNPGDGTPSFTVFTQSVGASLHDAPSMPVAGDEVVWDAGVSRGGFWRHVKVSTSLQDERWVKFVSPGAYAFAQPEDGATRIYTPLYSVLVPRGWIGDGWCFTYNDGISLPAPGSDAVAGKHLDIYASAADREAGDPAMTYECWNSEMDVAVAADEWAAGASTGGRRYTGTSAGLIETDGYTFAVKTLSWRFSGDQDKIDAGAAASLWSGQASTQISQLALQQAPVQTSAELWHVRTPWYSFDVPEPWRGRVQVSFPSAGEAVVSLAGNPGAWLVRTQLTPAATEHPAGDVGAAALFQLENGRGQFVTLRGFNLPFVLQGGGWREGYVHGLDPADPELEQEAVDLATGGAFTAEQVLAGAEATGAAFAYYQQAVIPTLQVEMDEDWARLAAFWLSLDEKYLHGPVSDFYAQAVEALGDDPAWLNDLAVSSDVQEWSRWFCPLSTFLVTVLARVVNYPEAATSDLTVADFAAQFAPQPR